MNRAFWVLPALLGVLLAPTGAWEASTSQNVTITISPGTQSVGLKPTTLTFASQNTGTSSSAQTITATSTGTAAFALSSVAISGTDAGDYSQTNNCPSSLAANATCTISVTFSPTTTGTRTASVVVTATGGGTVTAALSGTATTAATVTANAFYVATNGSNSNAGTLAAPFLTLGKCQTAMRGSSTNKTCYVRAGTYNLTGGSNCSGNVIDFTSSDNGETWSYYPPDGVDTAILDAGASSSTSGYNTIFAWDNANNITINGLQFQHTCEAALKPNGYSGGTDTNTVIENNIIHDGYNNGVEVLNNVQNSTISNNYIYNMTVSGINVTSSSGSFLFNNLTISNNFIYNTCTAVSDCGAIYIQDIFQPSSTGIKVTNNYVRDVGAGGGGRGIYLDDGQSNTTITGNIITGTMLTCLQIHGGSNNVFSGNICDEGSSGNVSILTFQQTGASGTWPMTGNSLTNNIIIASSTGGGGAWGNSWGDPTSPTVTNNAYYNYVGSTVAFSQSGTFGYGDSNPTYQNPSLSCWVYSIATGAAVLNTPVNFPPIAGGWGPPGFVIPQVGTPPSSPHGC